MVKRNIQINVQTLAQILDKNREDFTDLKSFISYKKNTIYDFRDQLLSQIFQQKISEIDLDKTEFGKPFLIDYPHFSFNHSHSQNHYALATSDKIKNIGVDIEDLDRKVRFEALAKHAFHPEEYQIWQDLDFDASYWFKVWTTKEAVLKASGLGIRLSLNQLNTHIHPEQDGGMCSHDAIGHFAFQNFQLSHAMLTLAWQAELSCKGFAFPQIQLIQGE